MKTLNIKLILILTLSLFTGCKKQEFENKPLFDLDRLEIKSLSLSNTIMTAASFLPDIRVDGYKHFSTNIEGKYEEWIAYSEFSGLSKDSGTQVLIYKTQNTLIIGGSQLKFIKDLKPNTTYYARYYCKFEGEVKYSNEISFSTLNYTVPDYKPAYGSFNKPVYASFVPKTALSVTPDYSLLAKTFSVVVDGNQYPAADNSITHISSLDFYVGCDQLPGGSHVVKFFLDGVETNEIPFILNDDPVYDMSNVNPSLVYSFTYDTVFLYNTPAGSIPYIRTVNIGNTSVYTQSKKVNGVSTCYFIVPDYMNTKRYQLKINTGCHSYITDSIWVNKLPL